MMIKLTKNMVFNFLRGQSTPLEKQLLEEWLKSTENMELYYQWVEEYEKDYPQLITDTELALTKFLISTESPNVEQVNAILERKKIKWFAIAASLLILLVSGLLGKDFLLYKNCSTGFGEVKSLKLEDGTTVTLNSNTKLYFSRFALGSRAREVLLEGEAEFKVVHTKDNRPFFVRTPNHLQVEVLGTSFIVYGRETTSKVVLNEGSVRLKSLENDKNLSMKPGDVVTMNGKQEYLLKKEQSLDKYRAWKDKRFVFEKTSLREIIKIVKENFGIEVVSEDSFLLDRELTGTYKVDNAEDFLEMLATSMDLRILKKRNQFILKNNY